MSEFSATRLAQPLFRPPEFTIGFTGALSLAFLLGIALIILSIVFRSGELAGFAVLLIAGAGVGFHWHKNFA